MPINQEKAIEWGVKAMSALIIPILIWSFKLSTQVALLDQRVETQEKAMVEMKKDLKERIKTANDKLDRILERLSQ